MIELYLFLLALLAITILISRRTVIFQHTQKKQFKEEVSSQVEENRKQEHTEIKNRFKDDLAKERANQKFDLGRYKDEIRKAELAMAKKQWNEAKRFLIQAISLSMDDFQPSMKLAEVYMESGDHRRAETLFRRLLETDSANPYLYESLGKIFVKRKNYKEAIRAYARAVELDEKDDQKFLALGKLYHLLMHYSVAAECFRRAAELKPRDTNYLFMLAEACAGDDDLDNALFTYERILTMEPYNEVAKGKASDLRLKIKENETFLS
jgi:tetratricopeptide (TPR) repeat protein